MGGGWKPGVFYENWGNDYFPCRGCTPIETSLVQYRANAGWPKTVSYPTLSIYSLNIDQFSHFFTSRLCKKFATLWHAHYAYYVAASMFWNTLPNDIQSTPSVSSFRRPRKRSKSKGVYRLTSGNECWNRNVFRSLRNFRRLLKTFLFQHSFPDVSV